MKDRFDLFLQPPSYHCLSDPVAHGGHTEDSRAAAMRFRYLHRTHRRREIGPRRHPIPDLVQIALEIRLERRQVHTVNPWCTLVRLDLLVCLPDLPLRNLKRFRWTSPKTVEACTMRSSHARNAQEVRSGVQG